MELLDARELVRRGMPLVAIISSLFAMAATRIQFDRGRPVGAVGASVEVALDRLIFSAGLAVVLVAAGVFIHLATRS